MSIECFSSTGGSPGGGSGMEIKGPSTSKSEATCTREVIAGDFNSDPRAGDNVFELDNGDVCNGTSFAYD